MDNDSRLVIWDPDGGSVDFDSFARWKVLPVTPREESTDQFGDDAAAIPPDATRAQIHPGRCTLFFYAYDLVALHDDSDATLYAWLNEFIRQKRSTLTVYVRQAMGDSDVEGRLESVYFFAVDAVDFPGFFFGLLSEMKGEGMPESEAVLSIEFICSAWGRVEDIDTAPDWDEESPSNCTVLWRRTD